MRIKLNSPEEKKARKKLIDSIYRLKNKEKQRIYMESYREKNAEKYRSTISAWHAKHPERIAAMKKSYCDRNPEKVKNTKKAWEVRNPDHRRINKSRRRALERNAKIGDMKTILKWEASWRTLRWVFCFWCNKRISGNKAHSDHIQSLKSGGSHSIENLCISCPRCNQTKSGKTLVIWNNQISNPILL